MRNGRKPPTPEERLALGFERLKQGLTAKRAVCREFLSLDMEYTVEQLFRAVHGLLHDHERRFTADSADRAIAGIAAAFCLLPTIVRV